MSGVITVEISDEELQDLDQLHTLARYFCEMTQDNGEQWKEDCESVEGGFRVLERLWKEWSDKQ
jgi:hypothetical protein